MLETFLPRQIDNTYRGHTSALWLFGIVVLIKTVMSVNSIIMGHNVASSADGVPLDTFTPAGAQAVVALFATWGVGHLTLCLLCWLVLVRYRSFIPFMFAVLLGEQLLRKLVGYFLPIVHASSPGATVNLVLLTLMFIGLALSLWDQRRGAHANQEVRGANP